MTPTPQPDSRDGERKCPTCTGLGYVVYDAEFDPYPVECPTCSGAVVR